MKKIKNPFYQKLLFGSLGMVLLMSLTGKVLYQLIMMSISFLGFIAFILIFLRGYIRSFREKSSRANRIYYLVFILMGVIIPVFYWLIMNLSRLFP